MAIKPTTPASSASPPSSSTVVAFCALGRNSRGSAPYKSHDLSISRAIATGDRRWLNKVRPFWGHDYHFHIRIGCQPGSTDCKGQESTGSGDGCDQSLAWWFTEEPWRPATGPQKPRARDVMKLSDLPRACRAVLEAPAPVSEAAVTVYGRGSAVAGTAAPVAAGAVPAMNAYAPTPPASVPLPTARPRD